MSSSLFEIRNLSKSFRVDHNSGDGKTTGGMTRVLEISNLSIPAGKLVAIVGGSGVGKTTLLNLLGGLDRPDPPRAGAKTEILLSLHPSLHADFGLRADLVGASRHLSAAISRHVSYVFQSSYLLEAASVELNLEIMRAASGGEVAAGELETALLLAQFAPEELTQKLKQRVLTMSGGEKKRLGLARAFVRDPFIIFADEPTSDLDPKKAKEAIAALKQWVCDGKGRRSALWVTHDYDLVEAADAILPINNGRASAVIPLSRLSAGANRRAAIERLVYDDPAPEEAFASPTTIEATPNKLSTDRSPIGNGTVVRSKRGLSSEMRNGVRLAGYEMLAPPLEQDERSRWSPARLIDRYTQSASALVILMLAFLSLVSLNVALQVQSYFTSEIDNPRLRHVVVEGDIRQSEFPIANEALKKLDDDIRKATHGKHEQRAAFGRLTDAAVSISATDAQKKAEGKSIDAEILRIDIDEPISDVLEVTTIAGDTTTLRRLLKDARYPSVIVSRRFLDRLAQRNGGAWVMPDFFLLKHHGTDVVFRLVGIADSLPTDGTNVFDGVVSHRHHLSWMMEVNSNALEIDPTVPHQYRIPNYERVAVYFSRQNYRETISLLDAKLYLFDRANLDKLRRLISVALRLDAFLYALLIAVLVVVAVVNAMLVRIYLQTNEKQLAVLMAHGVADALAVASVLVQIVTSWMLSHAVIFALGMLGLLGLTGLQWINLVPDGSTQEILQLVTSDSFILTAWLAPLLTLGMLVMATVLFFWLWKSRLPPLAQVLRQA